MLVFRHSYTSNNSFNSKYYLHLKSLIPQHYSRVFYNVHKSEPVISRRERKEFPFAPGMGVDNFPSPMAPSIPVALHEQMLGGLGSCRGEKAKTHFVARAGSPRMLVSKADSTGTPLLLHSSRVLLPASCKSHAYCLLITLQPQTKVLFRCDFDCIYKLHFYTHGVIYPAQQVPEPCTEIPSCPRALVALESMCDIHYQCNRFMLASNLKTTYGE